METVKRWAINIVKVIVAIFVIAIGFEVATYWLLPEHFAETPNKDGIYKYIVRCDSLWEAIELDSQCLDAAPGCTLTRDELADSKKRVEKYQLFCVSN